MYPVRRQKAWFWPAESRRFWDGLFSDEDFAHFLLSGSNSPRTLRGSVAPGLLVLSKVVSQSLRAASGEVGA
jgi:hypothetical protein